MLILTRQRGQSIIIGDDIVIHLISITKNYVQIGIEAPKNIQIYREEIKQKIEEEKHTFIIQQ